MQHKILGEAVQFYLHGTHSLPNSTIQKPLQIPAVVVLRTFLRVKAPETSKKCRTVRAPCNNTWGGGAKEVCEEGGRGGGQKEERWGLDKALKRQGPCIKTVR